MTWAWLAHLQCRELHWAIQENRFPQIDKGFKLRVTSGVVFQRCARTDYVRSLLGDRYEVYDVTLSPSDWGHTCMKRPRFFTLVFRKEIVQVRRKPAVVLQQLCDTVKRQIQVFLSIGDYLEWTPTAHLQDQEPLLASFSPEALAGILSCSKTCIYRGSLSNVLAAGRYLSECEKIWGSRSSRVRRRPEAPSLICPRILLTFRCIPRAGLSDNGTEVKVLVEQKGRFLVLWELALMRRHVGWPRRRICESLYIAETLLNAMSLPAIGLALLTVLFCADMRSGLSE